MIYKMTRNWWIIERNKKNATAGAEALIGVSQTNKLDSLLGCFAFVE